jgi:hypothetical protein
MIDITQAARRLGIHMSIAEDNGTFRCDWYDPMTNTTINGEVAKDKENAFELACNHLVDYLKTK